MSRSGYSDDIDNWALIRYRGAVASSFHGRRGRAFLREMLDALDALAVKRLVAEDLEAEGEVCALGAVGRRRGMDMTDLDPCDAETMSYVFGVAPAFIREVTYMNDEHLWKPETPEERFSRMRDWIVTELDVGHA